MRPRTAVLHQTSAYALPANDGTSNTLTVAPDHSGVTAPRMRHQQFHSALVSAGRLLESGSDSAEQATFHCSSTGQESVRVQGVHRAHGQVIDPMIHGPLDCIVQQWAVHMCHAQLANLHAPSRLLPAMLTSAMCQERSETIGLGLSSMQSTPALMHSCGNMVLQLGGFEVLMKILLHGSLLLLT